MNTSSLFNLTGKTAIITGGGNGIGRASSKMLASFGANVVVSDYNLEAAKQVAKDINYDGGSAIAVKCDVTNDGELMSLVESTIKTYKHIHILVNNVGGGGGGKENPFEIKLDQFRGVFERNLFSMWRLSQLVAPHMQEAGYGSIINMSSMASIDKSPAMSAYASSKAAVNHMTRNLAFDYGPVIRVNAIGPGAIKTDALASVLTDEIEKKMLKNTPLGRLGEPEDIAGAVLYFAAPISKWVSGQIIFVNGGGNQTLE